MSTDHAYCSVCDADWADGGPCEHVPGKKYEGKLAYITTGDLSYREVSFVNIPADEFAKVEGSIIEDCENKAVDMKVYANSAEEKILCDLGDSKCNNLYDYLVDEYDEEEDTIVHLIDNTSKNYSNSKEDQMSKEKELTKDQLKDMDSVKELIKEATDKASKECEAQLKKIKEECEKAAGNSDSSEIKKELEATTAKLNAAIDAQTALSKEKEAFATERNQAKDELSKIEEERKTILDENVSLNSELHKLNAERLFDLKSELKKPDVAGVKTIEDRDKKVDEFAQRSIDSLKDQIKDLLVEKSAAPAALRSSAQVSNPGIVHEDSGEMSKKSKNKKNETKGDTLKRLFNQGK
jgi:chromosome segregation ATPase